MDMSEALHQRAREILRLIHDLRGEMGLREALDTVIERYVEHEEHPEMKRFSEVIALARRQAVLQVQLDDDREMLHHGHLNHEELVVRGHHYQVLRHQACSYNHLLRNVIQDSGQYLTYRELMEWLTTASQGRHEWARAEVKGALSEIALHAALQGMPEIRDLRYATLEEDLAGYDFVAEWQGKLLTLDAKTGHYWPLSERKHGHRHLEISVPSEVVREFRVTRKGLDSIRRQVRQALYRGSEGYHHVEHAGLRPVRV